MPDKASELAASELAASELAAIPPLLERLGAEDGLKGALVSIARAITGQGADYLLAVKANQPTLRAEVEAGSGEGRALDTHADLDKGHGRIVEAITDGMYHPSMKEKMTGLEARKTELTAQRSMRGRSPVPDRGPERAGGAPGGGHDDAGADREDRTDARAGTQCQAGATLRKSGRDPELDREPGR